MGKIPISCAVLFIVVGCSSTRNATPSQQQPASRAPTEVASETAPHAAAEAPSETAPRPDVVLSSSPTKEGRALRIRAVGPAPARLRRQISEGFGIRRDCNETLQGCVELAPGAEILVPRCGAVLPDVIAVESCPVAGQTAYSLRVGGE